MAVTMIAKGVPVGPQDIKALESRLEVRLPSAYREFLCEYNVAVPAENKYEAGETTTSVTSFFGISDNRMDDLIEQNRLFAYRIPDGTLAIADAAGGNLICLDLESGKIYLWDHEEEAAAVGDQAANFDNMYELAESFSEFLRRIESFDPGSVQLDPNNVISVSIEFAPGTEEKFKKYFKDPSK
jgi:SMI1-KNR4 cell-wall